MNLPEFAQRVTPWLAAAATGNIPGLVALAASTVAQVIGKPVAATSEAINGAIASISDPDVMLKLKDAENQFRESMAKMGFDTVTQLATIAYQDTDSARKREIAIRDNVPRNIAYVLTIGFAGLMWAFLFITVPEANKAIVYTLTGGYTTVWLAAMQYYYGHTASGAVKDSTIADIAKAP
jgi:hypothetical protein